MGRLVTRLQDRAPIYLFHGNSQAVRNFGASMRDLVTEETRAQPQLQLLVKKKSPQKKTWRLGLIDYSLVLHPSPRWGYICGLGGWDGAAWNGNYVCGARECTHLDIQ